MKPLSAVLKELKPQYILHYEWPWWVESTVWTDHKRLVSYLYSGFVPAGCKIIIEHSGKRHEWDRDAAYAKPYRKAPITLQLQKLHEQQEADRLKMAKYLAKTPKREADA